MADEINLRLQLNVTKDYLSIAKQIADTFDLTGSKYSASVQVIGTVYEALSINSDITTPGFALFINHDAANFVDLSLDQTNSFAKILKGQVALIPLATTTIYVRANTAACNLEHLILEA